MDHGWIRVREAAQRLSISESTVRRWIADGRLRGRTGRSGRREVYLAASSDWTQESIQAQGQEQEQDPTELIKRYERIAGGSLLLAQRRADELTRSAEAAYEHLAHTRQQLRQVRKLALVGWASCVAVLLVGVVTIFVLGISNAGANAAARANQEMTEKAQQQIASLHEKLEQANQNSARLLTRVSSAED